MRAALFAVVVAVAVLAIAPAADARPPEPGGHCEVKEEYITGAYATGSLLDGTFAVHFGAPRPIECYY